MTSPRPVSRPPRAAALGVGVLAEIVGRTEAAVFVLGPERRIVYANTAATGLTGETLLHMRGRDVLEYVTVDERSRLAPYLHLQPGNGDATFSCSIRGPGTDERVVVGSKTLVHGDAGPLVAIVVWDQSGPLTAARAGAALAQTAAQVGVTTVENLLSLVARYAVDGTRAIACTVVVVDENEAQSDRGAYAEPTQPGATSFDLEMSRAPLADEHLAARWVSAMTGDVIRVGDPAGKPVVLPDAAAAWQEHPITRAHIARVAGLTYRAVIGVPLVWRARVIGLCTLYLPPDVAVVTESELAFVTALADQAALAVNHARLTVQAGETAALSERARLARRLHDSVSQSLFAMTMHARAAQLAADVAGVDPSSQLARSLAEVGQLTRDAAAEMRALIFELRPEGLSEDGLVAALTQQATVLSAREGFAVDVDAPDERIALRADVEEHLYRIGVEALNNIVKHARASRVDVRLGRRGDRISLTITDDGVGFSPSEAHPGHLGLSTMADRSRAIGAELDVRSGSGAGTVVAVTLTV